MAVFSQHRTHALWPLTCAFAASSLLACADGPDGAPVADAGVDAALAVDVADAPLPEAEVVDDADPSGGDAGRDAASDAGSDLSDGEGGDASAPPDADADGSAPPATLLTAQACPPSVTPLRRFETHWPEAMRDLDVAGACGLRYAEWREEGEVVTTWRGRDERGVESLEVLNGETVERFERYALGGEWFEVSVWTEAELERDVRWGVGADGVRRADVYLNVGLGEHWSIVERAEEGAYDRVVAFLGGAFRRFAHRQAERFELSGGEVRGLTMFESFPYGLPNQLLTEPLEVASELTVGAGGVLSNERGAQIVGVASRVAEGRLVVASVRDANETSSVLAGGALDAAIPHRVSDLLGVGFGYDGLPGGRSWSPESGVATQVVEADDERAPAPPSVGYWRGSTPTLDEDCVRLPRATGVGYPDAMDLYDLGAPVGERSADLLLAYGIEGDDLDGHWVSHAGTDLDPYRILGMTFDEGAVSGIRPLLEVEAAFDEDGRPVEEAACTTLVGDGVVPCGLRLERAWTYDSEGRALSDTVWWSGTALVTREVEGVTVREEAPVGPHGRRLVAERDAEGRIIQRTLEEWEARWPDAPDRESAWDEVESHTWTYDAEGRWVSHRVRRPARVSVSPMTPRARASQVSEAEVFCEYDDAGRVALEGVRIASEGAGEPRERRLVLTWSGDGASRTEQRIDGLGEGAPRTETTTYDAEGRPTGVLHDDESDGVVDRSVTWTYGADGRARRRVETDAEGAELSSVRWVYGCDEEMAEEATWPAFSSRPVPPRFPGVTWAYAPWESGE